MSVAHRPPSSLELRQDGATPTEASPSLPWTVVFMIQHNEALLRKVRRYARRISASVAEAGGIGGETYAEELVQDAITDTAAGVLTWDPSAATLESHLMSRIRSRGRDERRRALQVPHLSFDEPAEDEGESSTVLEEVEQTLCPPQHDADAEHARDRMKRLRALATADADLQGILDAIDDGAEGKAEILAATGLSERAYRNARVRLCRLGDQIFGPGPRGAQEERPS